MSLRDGIPSRAQAISWPGQIDLDIVVDAQVHRDVLRGSPMYLRGSFVALLVSALSSATTAVAQSPSCAVATLDTSLRAELGGISSAIAKGNSSNALMRARTAADLLETCGSSLPENGRGIFLDLFSSYLQLMTLKTVDPSEVEPLARKIIPLAQAITGPDSEESTMALDNLASLARQRGRRDESLALQRRVLELMEKRYGPDHQYLASILNDVAVDLAYLGRYEEADPMYRRALAIQEQTHGPEHPTVALYLQNLASNLHQLDKHEEALSNDWRALAIKEKHFGVESAELVHTLNDIAAPLHFNLNRLREAEPILKRVLAIQEKLNGREHPKVASALNNLAFLYTDLNQWEIAEQLLRRALFMQQKLLAPQHADIALTLNNLSVLYAKMGSFSEAEPLIRQALAIRVKELGPDSPAVILSMSNLARILNEQGRHTEAEAIYGRVLAIRERTFGPEHKDVATSLVDLAATLFYLERDSEAERLDRRALAIVEKTLGPDHLQVASVLNALAASLSALHRYEEALPLASRALAIREKGLPAGHPDIAYTLNNLAFCLSKLRRYAEAESFQKRALGITQNSLGLDHPEVAIRLNELAANYQDQGRYLEAEPLYRRSLEIRRKALPANHPYIALSLNNLASLYYEQHAWSIAIDYARQAGQIVIERARQASRMTENSVSGAGESELSHGTAEFHWLIRAAWRLAQQQPSDHMNLADEAFAAWQWSAQTSAGSALVQMTVRFAKGGGELASLVREQQTVSDALRRLDKQVIVVRSASPEARNAATEASLAAQTSDAERHLASLNERLTHQFPEYAALTAPEPLTIKAALSYLGPDEALVAFSFVGNEAFAWVLTGDATRWIRVHEPTDGLVKNVEALRCGLDATLWDIWLASGPAKKCKAVLGAVPVAETVTVGDKEENVQILPFDLVRAHELYKALLGPVEDLIKGKHLLIVPSGPLTGLPFSVLVIEPPKTAIPAKLADYRDVSWLGARQPITVLPSVASFKALRQFAKTSQASRLYLGIGNPLLDGDQTNPQDQKRARLARDKQECPKTLSQRMVLATVKPLAGIAKLFRGATADIESVRELPPLPETADELCEVARRLGVPDSEILLGASATETKLKELSEQGRLADYAILHFATHGALSGQVTGSAEPGLILTPPPKETSDPKALERDDGFLTASEIATLKMDADWVILSACNTAGAQSENVEALSGMARAFFYAGARALLVSHWEVGSDAAVKLTTRAFDELKAHPKIGRAEAFRRSMKELIERGSLAEAHPSQWAPFVVVGEGAASR
jgi:CHAT domain-containing protein/tetratricopeptide (TPR) repeat protein